MVISASSPPPPSRTRLVVGIGVGVAGVIATGTGLVFGSKASSTYDDAKQVCGAELVCSSQADLDKSKRLVDDARSQATLSTALVVAGSVAVVAGAVLVLTAPRRVERATAAQLVPTAHDRGAGLALIGQF